MKRVLFTATVLMTLVACSTSNESKQQVNDGFVRKGGDMPVFAPLASGGVNLPQADNTYQLPQLNVQRGQNIDIRPPTSPVAMIQHSIAQFDGERSLIAYPLAMQDVYSLAQVERLLKEKGISFTSENNKILTDWTGTGRADDIGDTQIRYQIEQISTKEASALFVSVVQMKRDNVIFTPSVTDKQRYTSDRLNQLVGELNTAYQKQQQELNQYVIQNTPIQTALIIDMNGRPALALGADFNQAWKRLGDTLGMLGFETQEENAGRGFRSMKYSPLEDEEWLRVGVTKPDLEKGVYSMQLSALGKQSAVVISDENGKALSDGQAQAVYQALQVILAK